MADKSAQPYLSQTLAVLNRTGGVALARIRAIGFLQQRLNGRLRDGRTTDVLRDRPSITTRVSSGRVDLG